jgi:prepilin-type N-terminal cleavage/methylation domain
MNHKQSGSSGFTLVELMVTVAIVAILATIAYPSYQGHLVKTRRATAAACLTELSAFMERYYTTHMTYEDADLPDTQCQNDLAGFYTFALDGDPTAGAYSLTATAEGVQASKDTKCGDLSVDQAGTKSVSISGTDPKACF